MIINLFIVTGIFVIQHLMLD